MANQSVEDILNMKSYQLKEFLEDHHVPVPKRQSKEFLQTVALQAHADLEAESSKRRIITRRRSKREETDLGTTYSSIYGRSTSMPRSSPLRNSPQRSSITTRSRVQAYTKTDAESPDVRGQELEEKVEQVAAIVEPAAQDQDRLQEEGLSYSAMLNAATPSSPTTETILSTIDINQQAVNAGNQRDEAAAKQDHTNGLSRQESAEQNGKLAMRPHQEMEAVPQVESIKESNTNMKAIDDESNKKQSRPNQQEVVKKIIRVNDEAAENIKKPSPPYNKEAGHHVKGHHHTRGGQASTRMQRLKRSASMIMSQVNERVFKRLRKVPSSSRLHNLAQYRPSLHVSIALLMCAMCVTAIGVASYWHHLKKLEEQSRARKRWLW